MIIKRAEIPGDKSISHRALILGAIAEGDTRIKNFSNSGDCRSTFNVLKELGVNVAEKAPSELVVRGVGLRGFKKPGKDLYAGNSGTTMRLMSGALAGQAFDSVVTGDASLSKRPMKRVLIPLREMNAEIEGVEDNYPPLRIRGSKLHSIDYDSPVASAQVKSCLMLAGLYAEGETTVTEPVKSRDHTERMMKYMGAEIKEEGLKVTVNGGSKLQGREIEVPGDISSAAYFIVAALLKGGETEIECVGVNNTRTGIINVLKKMGGKIEFKNPRSISNEPVADIHVEKGQLRGIEIIGEDIPGMIDEIPVIAVAATQAEGKTVISGARELRVKETDRIKAICSELAKMGAKIQEKEDGMIIEGPTPLKPVEVNSYGDHRMAMALSIACLVSESGTDKIINKECCEISFPGFFNVFSRFKSNEVEA